ncbi:multidrug effflux MFS transporter [Hymenobacter mucosus]|uniref:MFS transporter, DHA1 family, bicyclomycin/chloramphenicol resistance protein n=2 Tax=Hymenobacter TaxID=89966 RepID=A0A238XHD2_9BACT|nr:multidrug effflux MFS transporter [Hymenobacter mucosus]SNR58415.1 MFS transporter, DHA1 family, bicyclomycin/chloramphenicol resistance protein [Hymenobacter mucosus]
MTKQRYFFLILILGSLSALGPFSIDMYLPGFPAIAKDLHTTVARVALSLSSFFVGVSAGQLLYGPLLDRFGRKKPLYVGLVLYVVASAGCYLAHSIDALIALRLLQALGSCAATVAAVAMVRDLFPVQDSPKVFSLLMLVISVSPMLAPTVGGYLVAGFGWQSVFVALFAMGALLLVAAVFWLPESYAPDPTYSLHPRPILTTFFSVLREPQFFTYALTGAMTFGGLLAYVSGSPLVFMDIFRVSGQVYGWIFAGLSVGFIGASQVNTWLLRFYRSEQIVLVAIACQSVIGLVFLLGASQGWFGVTGTIVMLFLFLCCMGLANPNAAALSIAPFSKNAGSAAALMGATQMAVGALASLGVSLFNTNTAVPMVAIMATSAVLALGILLLGRRLIGTTLVSTDGQAVLVH